MSEAKVALDLRMIAHSGIGSYLRSLLWFLRHSEEAKDFFFLFVGDPDRLEPHLSSHYHYQVVPFHAAPYSFKEQLFYPSRRLRGSVLHFPHYPLPLSFRGQALLTIHDFNHWLNLGGFRTPLHHAYARHLFRSAIHRARKILLPSRFVLGQLQTLFPKAAHKSEVIPEFLGGAFSSPTPEMRKRILASHKLPEEFLLTVGIFKPHKNYPFLFRSLAALWKQGELTLPLVVLGMGKKAPPRLLRLLEELGIAGQVCFAPFVKDEVLTAVYGGAKLLVLPSLYEGFGRPVLEAMKAGVPLLLSDIATFREVAADAALFFSPTKPGALREQLLKLLNDPGWQQHLSEQGHERVQFFDPHRWGSKLLALYRQLLR